jgi:hypothetical protein
MDNWADGMNKIIRIDKRDVKQIVEVIRWAHSDDFWKTNILSPDSLRAKFDQLIPRMNNGQTRTSFLQDQISNSDRPSKYWNDLKKQLIDQEGFSKLFASSEKLPMPSADGKMRGTEVVNTKALPPG